MAAKPTLETLADVYQLSAARFSGNQQGNLYRFGEGAGHLSLDNDKLEYDEDRCKIAIQPDVEQGLECFRVEYTIYPDAVNAAIDSSLSKGQNKKLQEILKGLVPKTPLRRFIIKNGFTRGDDDAPVSHSTAYDAKHVYQLIEAHVKSNDAYLEATKTFINNGTPEQPDEKRECPPVARPHHRRRNHRSQRQRPGTDTPKRDPESPGIAV